MARPILNRFAAILLLAWLLPVAACATAGAPGEAPKKYPQRAGGCEIALYHTAVPGAAAWDDLGLAEIACHVSSPLSQCHRMLKAEGRRLGGDMIYNVPREPLRPQDQVLVFRGQVAHTLAGKAPKSEASDPDLPPAASPEESALPVVPLTGPAAPKAP